MTHQVVAIEGDVEGACRHVVTRDLFERAGDATRQRDAATAHTNERDLLDPAIPFDDFVRNARQRA
jgi:hypothetical protein